MSRADWQRIRELFECALALPTSRREAFLANECRDDAALREKVERLLVADNETRLDRGVDVDLPSLVDAQVERTPPRRIGPYEIQRKIGSGGMGVVYEAVQDRPRRRVALKTLRLATETNAKRFRLESEILGHLRHPGIAQVFESGTEHSDHGTLPYFAMEYVAGARDIIRFSNEEGHGTSARIQLFLAACDAVHYGHQKGVIHRDLKPSNILVDDAGQLKVIDFGLARIAELDTDSESVSIAQTQAGQILGTLQYMSPEQFSGNPSDTDVASDVYALGVVLFELLSGELPFDLASRSLPEVALIVSTETPRRLGAVRSELAGDLEWIAAKAIAQERSHRYASVSELAADVRRYLADEPVVAGPPSSWYRVKKLVRRHRMAFTAACLLVAALLVGVVGTTWQWRVARGNLRERDVQFEIATEANGLLNGILSSIRPELAEGKEVTVRAAFDQAVLGLDAAPPKRPEVEASVRMTIGVTYDALGLHEEAIVQIARAEELFERCYGVDDERTLDARGFRGSVLSALGRLDEAGEVLESAAERGRDALGADHEVPLIAERNLAEVEMERSELDSALQRAKDVLARCETALGRVHGVTLRTLSLLVQIHIQRGEFDDGLARLDDLAGRRSPELGPLQPDVLYDEQARCMVLTYLQRLDEAEAAFEALLPKFSQVFGDAHTSVVAMKADLAYLLGKRGKIERAAPLLDKLVVAFREVRGREETEHLSPMMKTGMLLLDVGRVEEAEELLSANVSAAVRHGGKQTIATLHAQVCLANVSVAKSELDEAKELLTSAIDGLADAVGEDHWLYQMANMNLGGVWFRMGRISLAAERSEVAAAYYLREFGPDAPMTLLADNNHAKQILDTGDVERAIELLERTLEVRRRVLGETHVDALTTRSDLGVALQRHGDLARAQNVQREAWDDALETLGEAHRLSLTIAWRLADVLRERGEYEEAQALIERVRELEQEQSGVGGFESHEIYARLLLDHGDLEAAQRELRELFEATSALPTGHYRRYVARALLGSCLARLDETDRGVSHLRESVKALQRALGPASWRTNEAAAALEAANANQEKTVRRPALRAQSPLRSRSTG